MITTVSFNPAIDRTIIVGDFKVGQLNRSKATREDVAGKGINVSTAVKLLGGDTTAIGFLGGANGEKIKDFLSSEGIKYDFVDTKLNVRTNIKIFDPSSQVNTEVNEPGEAVKEEHVDELKEKVRFYAQQSSFMVFTGSVQRNLGKGIYKELVEIANDYTNTVLDAEGELLKLGASGAPTIMKPNIYELVDAFGILADDERSIIESGLSVIYRNNIKYMLLSLGEDGSLLISGEAIYRALPIKLNVKSTSGAGDAMLGGFLYELDRGENIEEAFRMSVACASLSVLTEGPCIRCLDGLQDIIKHVEIEKV